MYQSILITVYTLITNLDYVNILNNMIDVFTNKFVLFFLSYVFVYYFGSMRSNEKIIYSKDNPEMRTENNFRLYEEYKNKYSSLKRNVSEQIEIEKTLIENKFKKELNDLKRENRNLSRVNKRYFEDNIELSKKVFKNTIILFHTTTGKKLHHKKSCTCLNDIECYNLEIEEKVYDFMERCDIFCKSCI